MRKLILLFVICFVSLCANCQDSTFKVSKERLTDYVIGQIPNKTASELYKGCLDWISITYKNPKEVIKAQIDSNYIRIEGSEKNMLCIKSLGLTSCDDARYQIEISFKDGKYKFDVVKLEKYTSYSQYSTGGWSNVTIDNTSYMFKDNGDLKNIFKLYPQEMELTFNTLNKSLKDYLNESNIKTKNDW
jgi:hypothetical protein